MEDGNMKHQKFNGKENELVDECEKITLDFLGIMEVKRNGEHI